MHGLTAEISAGPAARATGLRPSVSANSRGVARHVTAALQHEYGVCAHRGSFFTQEFLRPGPTGYSNAIVSDFAQSLVRFVRLHVVNLNRGRVGRRILRRASVAIRTR